MAKNNKNTKKATLQGKAQLLADEQKKKEYEEEWNSSLGYCEELIEKAIRILQQRPAILSYLSLVEFKPVKDPEVSMRLNCKGTGSYIHLEYNPVWMKQIDEASLLSYCMFSECLRIALHHITTRKNYPIDVFKKASDFICFDDCNREVLNLHKKNICELADTFPSKSEFHNIANGYKFNDETDWFLEKVFSILLDIKQKNEQNQPSIIGMNAQGQGQGQGNGQGNGDGDGDSDDSGDDSNGNGNGGGKSSNQKAMEEYFDSSAGAAEKATEGWEENSMVDQGIEQITHQISDTSSWGEVSGGLLQAILAANTPKLDPKTVLKRFKANTVDKYTEDTRMRPDRRKGFEVPGKRHKFRSRILIATDCSGSMSDDDIERACAIINKFVKHADVSYCFWDGECGPFEESRHSKKSFDLVGRGCTNPQCVIDAIVERKAKFDGVVIISDMQFCWNRPEHYANKIFGIHTANADPCPDWMRYVLSFEQLFSIE